MQLRFVLLCCALLSSVVFTRTTAAQTIVSDEEAHAIVRRSNFEGGWLEYPRSLVVSFRLNDVKLFTDDAQHPTCWGVVMPRDFHAILKVMVQDSKGRPLRVKGKAVPPIYLYNDPFTLPAGATTWSTTLPPEYFNPRGQLCIAAVMPVPMRKSNHCAKMPMKEAVVLTLPSSVSTL